MGVKKSEDGSHLGQQGLRVCLRNLNEQELPVLPCPRTRACICVCVRVRMRARRGGKSEPSPEDLGEQAAVMGPEAPVALLAAPIPAAGSAFPTTKLSTSGIKPPMGSLKNLILWALMGSPGAER